MTKKGRLCRSILWGVTLCVMAFLLFAHTYNDIVITTRHGLNFWKLLFDGDILRFFQLDRMPSGNAAYMHPQGCSYSILVYILFAVWNIPLALLETFANVDVMNNVLCLAYMKLLPITAMFLSAYLLRKIILLFSVPEEKADLLIYLFLSSSVMLSIVFVVSQYDTLSLVFQLLGLYAFMRKKDGQFIFWFGIAFCFKFFSLILFLPLLVLRHKKLLSWIKSLVLMILPWVLCKIPFSFGINDMYGDLMTGEVYAMGLGETLLSYSNSYMSLFVIAYVLLLVWCYLQDPDSETLSFKAIWAGLVSYAAFAGLLETFPYWHILLMPFLILSMAVTPRYFHINLLLETFGLSLLTLANILKYNWNYFGDTMDTMLMPHLLGHADYEGSLIYSLIQGLSNSPVIYPALNSVFIGAMCAMAFLTYPRGSGLAPEGWQEQQEPWDLLILRSVLSCGLCLLPVLSLFL